MVEVCHENQLLQDHLKYLVLIETQIENTHVIEVTQIKDTQIHREHLLGVHQGPADPSQ